MDKNTIELVEAVIKLQEVAQQLTALVLELVDAGGDSHRNPQKIAFLRDALGSAADQVVAQQVSLVETLSGKS